MNTYSASLLPVRYIPCTVRYVLYVGEQIEDGLPRPFPVCGGCPIHSHLLTMSLYATPQVQNNLNIFSCAYCKLVARASELKNDVNNNSGIKLNKRLQSGSFFLIIYCKQSIFSRNDPGG